MDAVPVRAGPGPDAALRMQASSAMPTFLVYPSLIQPPPPPPPP